MVVQFTTSNLSGKDGKDTGIQISCKSFINPANYVRKLMSMSYFMVTRRILSVDKNNYEIIIYGHANL